MYKDKKIVIGKSGEQEVFLLPQMANRHGLIAGATGTGKTTTLRIMAESFSAAGVPVFLADIKGDLTGISKPGSENEKLTKRLEQLSLKEHSFNGFPTHFWDIYGTKGLHLKTTISEMGPVILSKELGLTDVQTSVLQLIFKIADDEGLLIYDIKDLKAVIAYVGDNCKDFSSEYGNITKQTVNAILRAIINIESQGADVFFMEPALNITDMLCTNSDGQGMINLLNCSTLFNNPTLYSCVMLWLLSEFYEILPEVGDLEKPKLVFFFDEAHLLFSETSKTLLQKLEQMVKLSRSKGIGIYFITQNPSDIPDGILSQLSNKVQHALHAYTPKEITAVRQAAMSYRANPDFDTTEVITTMGVGEALVSTLDEEGIPTIVQKTVIYPPQSSFELLSDAELDQAIKADLLYSRYAQEVDSFSAYEFLNRRKLEAENEIQEAIENEKNASAQSASTRNSSSRNNADKKTITEREKAINRATKGVASTAAGTVGREIGNSIGNAIGGKVGKRLGGNIGASLGRGIIGTFFGLK